MMCGAEVPPRVQEVVVVSVFLQMAGTWRNSWRNSNNTLESREEFSKNGRNGSLDVSPPKRVHFPSTSAIACEIDPEQQFITEEELDGKWYTKEEYAKFERDRILTSFGYIAAKRGGQQFNQYSRCIRGLETLTDDMLSRRECKERKAIQKSVKAEEQRQKAENCFPDMDKFRSVSLRHSKGATERAIAIANEDAKAVGSRSKSPVVESLYRRSPLALLNRSVLASCEK